MAFVAMALGILDFRLGIVDFRLGSWGFKRDRPNPSPIHLSIFSLLFTSFRFFSPLPLISFKFNPQSVSQSPKINSQSIKY
jgi:hypothetical protein